MESQFLIMQLRKLDSPTKSMSEHQLIFFDIDDPRYIPFRRQKRSEICLENDESLDYQSSLEFDDFEDFIDVGYEWNTFLLASIVENCEMGFKIVQPQTRDRRYQKGIIIEANSSTDTYDGIVAATMKYHGIESLRENQFLSFLVLNHLTTKATPRELQLSDVIKYENETYSV